MSIYTVSQVNSYIKNMFQEDFALNNICIKGEVSNCKYHSSGHIYFSLKDSTGVLNAVMFSSDRSTGLKFQMQEGQNVQVTGRITVYERSGSYQMYARNIVLDGAGELYQKFEEMKAQMEEMGMFSEIYKKPIPKFVKRVGIATAETGAALQDIKRVATRRNPFVELILCPVQVQGQGAAESIAAGIQRLDRLHLDVLIVGRGGGSMEDLWAFNEECVARAIFQCETPIISAVGHEVDFTIADFVADVRAATPSMAAELAVFEYEVVLNTIRGAGRRLDMAMEQKLRQAQNRRMNLELRLKKRSPENALLEKKQYHAELVTRMQSAMEQKLLARKHRLAILAERLEGRSPLQKLSSGYAYVAKDGAGIKSVSQLQTGEQLKIHFKDGHAKVTVDEISLL